jgi:hypothetical protein
MVLTLEAAATALAWRQLPHMLLLAWLHKKAPQP